MKAFTLVDQDWIGLMIFKNFADQDWIGFNFIGSGLDSDSKFHSPLISARQITLKQEKFSQSDPVLVANFQKILSDPVLIRPKLASLLIQSSPDPCSSLQ